MCVFQVILAYECIVLCKCSGKYIDIYFSLKITFSFVPANLGWQPYSNKEFQEYEEPVYSYSTHPVRRSPRDIHNILKLSPPFASSEGVGGDRYQSDSAHRTQPPPPRHCLLSRCRV